jgi:hypothetical protein
MIICQGHNDNNNLKERFYWKYVIYSNNVLFKIAQTDAKQLTFKLKKQARRLYSKLKKRTEKIIYSYKVKKSFTIRQLFIIRFKRKKFRDQEVKITLFLPLGTK